jgi:hypothetical protein
MARTLIVSDRHNSFFTANNIRVGTSIPTEGNYVKGDIIVNIGESASVEAMWLCVESGNPGLWEVVGSGAGASMVSINASMLIDEPVSELPLDGLGVAVTNKDKLVVHFNSVHLMEGIDYEISEDKTKIIKLPKGTFWNASGSEGCLVALELFKQVRNVEGNMIEVQTRLMCFQNNVLVEENATEVLIGMDFDVTRDSLLVFENNTFLTESVDYEMNINCDGIVPIEGEWNRTGADDWSFTFVVFKDIPIADEDNKIPLSLLADDVKTAIEDASNIDLTGYATKEDLNHIDMSVKQDVSDENLITTNKTIVGAINELKAELNGLIAEGISIANNITRDL